jgi:hypothetical protein
MGNTTEALGQGIDIPNPSGAYVAKLSANGTGCPAGSWDGAISPDGKAFTVTFSQYEAIVNPGQAFSIKDCTLAITLQTPQGFSFSVSSFYYQGYATMDSDGMDAKQTAKYYFIGNPVGAQENAREVTGPWDDSYLFSDEIPLVSQVWSPCGQTRQLNAQTRLVLKNNAAKSGSGYLNNSTVDGDIQFIFGLSWRKC